MGDVVELHSQPEHLEDNQEFVADCCRYAENILSEEAVKKKYHFDDATWAHLGDNEALIEAIELEKIRRVRTGQQKRERAQVLVTQAPDVLGGIMLDASASPKHRVDAIKIWTIFPPGPEAAPAADRLQIVINLGDTSEVRQVDETDPNDIDPHNTDPNDIDPLPRGMIAAIAAKKKDGGSGEPI